jgi:hypothetical protein
VSLSRCSLVLRSSSCSAFAASCSAFAAASSASFLAKPSGSLKRARASYPDFVCFILFSLVSLSFAYASAKTRVLGDGEREPFEEVGCIYFFPVGL